MSDEVQAEITMFNNLDLYMPRLTPQAFEYVLLHLAVALQVKVPSLACGSVISNRIRAYLAHPSVDAWRLVEGCLVREPFTSVAMSVLDTCCMGNVTCTV